MNKVFLEGLACSVDAEKHCLLEILYVSVFFFKVALSVFCRGCYVSCISHKFFCFPEEVKVTFHCAFHCSIDNKKAVNFICTLEDPVYPRITIASFNCHFSGIAHSTMYLNSLIGNKVEHLRAHNLQYCSLNGIMTY